jgi:hypothetical protein
MPASTDETKLQIEIAATAAKLASLLAEVQHPTKAPNATRDEREAARWFYERIIDWRGILAKRTLTKNIEFIVVSDPDLNGWYYRNQDGNGNWAGPFPSHKAAAQARDETALAAALDATLANYEAMMA